MRRYGSEVAPEVSLSKIRIPVHILYGKLDAASTTEEALYLGDVLKEHGKLGSIKGYNIGHYGFVFSVIMPHIMDTLHILKPRKAN